MFDKFLCIREEMVCGGLVNVLINMLWIFFVCGNFWKELCEILFSIFLLCGKFCVVWILICYGFEVVMFVMWFSGCDEMVRFSIFCVWCLCDVRGVLMKFR